MFFRRFSEALRPVPPHQIVIAADAAGGDDHGLGTQREVTDDLARAAFFSSPARHCPVRGSSPRRHRRCRWSWSGHRRGGGTGTSAGRLLALCGPALRNGSTTPGPVPQVTWNRGNRITMAPSHRSRRAPPSRPRGRTEGPWRGAMPVFSPAAKRHIGFRPAPRPEILIAVEAGRPDPVPAGRGRSCP